MAKGEKKTILLVEDEDLIAIDEKNDLEEFGYKVIIANSGEKSIKIFNNNNSIDLVLMDINLGKGLDGTEAAAIILKNRDIPVVFLSSHTQPEIVNKTEKITSYGYVVKYSGITVLDASIKMAFKLFEANQKIKNELKERKRIENTLNESELKYRSLFKSMGQGFYLSEILYDADGIPYDYKYIDVNLAFEKIISLKKEQIIGKTYNELVPPDPESGWLECFKRVAETGTPENYTFPSAVYKTHFEVYAFKPEEGKFAALVKDITDRALAEETIKNLLKEKELILKEVHHRIKNNMNVIYSLLNLQSNAQADPELKKILQDAANRIKSMMILYDKLYRTINIHALSIKDYLNSLINEIVKIFPNKASIQINTQIEDIILDTREISSIGLIINELITNSMKFAFTGRNEGTITIFAAKKDKHIIIEFKDNGIGLPVSVNFENSTGFGMQLVGMLVKQINGSITIEKQTGTKFIIEFEE